MSDTHGWLDPSLHDWFAGVEMILHAGDVGNEMVLFELETIAPTVAVRGNVDGGPWARALPLERVVEVGGLRIAMLHIAGSPGRPASEAKVLMERERPDLMLVGHSHIPVIQWVGDVLWVNPGAAGRQGLHHERTAAVFLPDEERRIDFITLGPRGR
jgi:uncharacterized protein